jgi:hypothetical protein
VSRPLCRGCGLHEARPPTRRTPAPRFCKSCIVGQDQLPDAYDLSVARGRSRGVVHDKLEARARRLSVGQVLQARAERLLGYLTGIDRWVWHLVVDGKSERQIAEMLGISRQQAHGWYLQRLRVAAGIPARPRRYRGRAV